MEVIKLGLRILNAVIIGVLLLFAILIYAVRTIEQRSGPVKAAIPVAGLVLLYFTTWITLWIWK